MENLIVKIEYSGREYRVKCKLDNSSSHEDFVDFFKRIADSTYITVKTNGK